MSSPEAEALKGRAQSMLPSPPAPPPQAISFLLQEQPSCVMNPQSHAALLRATQPAFALGHRLALISPGCSLRGGQDSNISPTQPCPTLFWSPRLL